MLADYLNKAMQHAHFERIEDGTVFGSFQTCPVSRAGRLMPTPRMPAGQNCERCWRAGYFSTSATIPLHWQCRRSLKPAPGPLTHVYQVEIAHAFY